VKVVIKPIAIHDLALMLDIEQRSHSHPWTRGNFEDAFAAGYLVIGAWEPGAAGQLLGFAMLMKVLDEAELLDIAVAPEFRRSGVARVLLRDAQDRLRVVGCTGIYLEVRATNASARALYREQGFEEIGLRVGYYPAGRGREDAILMKKVFADY
jgi:[ribosomal protein S18]-alanine N-acetyltransferase